MKARIIKVLLNAFLYMVFVLLWGAILLVLTAMRIFDTFLDSFADGLLLKVFGVTSVIGIVITILFRKRMKYKWMLPVFLIVLTIITTSFNYGVLWCSFDYMSVYTREKWDKYPRERSCMIDSMNEQYEFTDMTEQEVITVLGEADSIFESDGRTIYQYVIGDVFKEHNAYEFIFEDGVVVDASFSQMGD